MLWLVLSRPFAWLSKLQGACWKCSYTQWHLQQLQTPTQAHSTLASPLCVLATDPFSWKECQVKIPLYWVTCMCIAGIRARILISVVFRVFLANLAQRTQHLARLYTKLICPCSCSPVSLRPYLVALFQNNVLFTKFVRSLKKKPSWRKHAFSQGHGKLKALDSPEWLVASAAVG